MENPSQAALMTINTALDAAKVGKKDRNDHVYDTSQYCVPFSPELQILSALHTGKLMKEVAKTRATVS